VVDLAALRANATDMTRRAAGKPIRLPSYPAAAAAVTASVPTYRGEGQSFG